MIPVMFQSAIGARKSAERLRVLLGSGVLLIGMRRVMK